MSVKTNNDEKYKIRNVVIDGMTYMTKVDKQTNQQVYKRKFSISLKGVKNPPRKVTKYWRTSITKVNHDVEKTRVQYRDGIIDSSEKKKHLYEDIVQEFYEQEVENCINHNRSFEVVEKFYSNNHNYVLKGKYTNFKHRFVEDLTVHDIKQLKKDIITVGYEKDLSVLTIGHIFTNIDRVLKYCSERMYIDDSIADNVYIRPKGKRRKKTSYSNFLLKDEYDELMKVFNTDFKFMKTESVEHNKYRKKLYETFFKCAFLLGFRKGEGFGLKWEDIEGEYIHINSTLNTKNVQKHIKTKTSRIINPKTNSGIRKMKMPKSIRELMIEWKKYCEEIDMTTNDDDYIFREVNGKHFNPTTFGNRFNLIIEKSGIVEKYNKQLYIHGFRHSCCSFLVQKLRESNEDISLREIEIAVGKYLGHAGGDMVREVYMHLYPEKEDSILNKLMNEL